MSQIRTIGGQRWTWRTRTSDHGFFGAVALALTIVAAWISAQAALAAPGKPQWTVTSVSRPTNFKPGDKSGDDAYLVTVTNTGDASSDGTPVVITDELPEGIGLDAAGAFGQDQLVSRTNPTAAKLSCVLRTCVYSGVVVPDDTLVLSFPVDVTTSQTGTVDSVVRVSGGGGQDAAATTPTAISTSDATFGVSPGGASTALSTTQAGAHPDLTTAIAFNTVNAAGALAGDPKNTIDDLPPGFAGDLVDTPICPVGLFALGKCPIATQVGVTTLTIDLNGGKFTSTEPVYNLSPNPGELAKLGFFATTGIPIEGEVSLRPSDYGLRTSFSNTNESPAELDNVSLTVWGVPSDPIHDSLRWKPGENLPGEKDKLGSFGVSSPDSLPAPFLTNPTACGNKQLDAVFSVTSWEQLSQGAEPTSMGFGPIDGCDRVVMEPSLTAEATTLKAYSATGLNIRMTIPQTYNNAEGLATSTLKRAVVALPEGMTVNPSAGAGLAACTETEFNEEEAQTVVGKGCPSESKLGTVTIESPAVKQVAKGVVFLAQPAPNGEPGRNPFNSLLALYVVARIPERGIVVKAAGKVTADPVTGRLVTTFDNLPPLPFSVLTFSFSQGATSPLVTPPRCGQYRVQAELTPWSEPAEVLAPEIPSFPISEAFDGGACPGSGLPAFDPEVLAGTQNNSAASYSPMYLRVIRADGQQEITRFSARLPAGLTANLSGVPFCSDASIALAKTRTGSDEEASPSCPAASQIGHTLVGAGVGSLLAYTPGKLYMAGPYNGAPFSIVDITSAKVGPFDLGTVVVREALEIDPNSAVVTVDASASDPIPHIIRGIVVHVRDIRVYVDRAAFTLNPTSCARMVLSATVSGSGADFSSAADDVPVTVNDPFQAANCQGLGFKPTFKVTTSGKPSRKNGASLFAKLTYPRTPQGTQANIRSVKVDLPKALPSRLSTLQKACPDQKFNNNPASCPAASRVGQATAITPILPVPLVGPAYFVSHGGARFPELVIVLQGYGVTVDLHGETFINKAGVTSSTFRTVPDQPVTSFELKLPQGANSALAAIGDLCASKLRLPMTFTAQNGRVIRGSTPVGVTGCPRHKAKARR